MKEVSDRKIYSSKYEMEDCSSDDTERCAYRCYIPRRYLLAFLAFMGMFNVYAMRVNLSVAMVAMVNSTTNANTSDQATECPNLISSESETNVQYKGVQYNWDAKVQSQILGAFFYGYMVTQMPGGMLSERFGAKWLFGGGVLVTAVLSLLTPLAASVNTATFITVRVLEGLGEGVTFPAVNVAISRWSPKVERSRISTIIFTGSQMGNVVAMPISGWLSSIDFLGGWPSVFYVFGSIGCVWFILWAVFMHENPTEHPSISKEELLYIQQNKDPESKKKLPIPWKAIFTSLPMWAVIIAHFGHNFGFLVLLTEMPTFLSGILHFDLMSNGLLSALPYVLQALTAWIVSFIADILRKSNTLSITTIRKICNSVGLLGPALCLLGVTRAGCNPELTVALLAMSLAFNGFVYSGFNITHVDMSPDLAGTLFGITNMISNVSGVLGPATVGYFTSSGVTIANWSKVFYVTAAIYIASAVFYAIFASAELQPWGVACDCEEPEKKQPNQTQVIKEVIHFKKTTFLVPGQRRPTGPDVTDLSLVSEKGKI